VTRNTIKVKGEYKMAGDPSRVDLGNGYFTDASGDLITVDKDCNDTGVIEGGFVTPEAMSHLEENQEWCVFAAPHHPTVPLHFTATNQSKERLTSAPMFHRTDYRE
jgi:hypothetical protein